MHILGARLRQLRRQRGLTLQEVAANVGLSHSFLSMLERGQTDISLGRAQRLGSFFDIPLSELLVQDHEQDRPRVIAVDEGEIIERMPGLTLRLLPVGRSLGLQVVHVRFEPRTGPSTPLSHDGEDFFWVLSGEVTFTYGADEHVLRTGESAMYAGRVHHFFENRRREAAEMLSITSPPYPDMVPRPGGRR
jgi:transcriptional regulator with XRE-family HTH domain